MLKKLKQMCCQDYSGEEISPLTDMQRLLRNAPEACEMDPESVSNGLATSVAISPQKESM